MPVARRPPFIAGALGSGASCGAYLYAISMHNMPLAIAIALVSWGIIYQVYNAVFPCFFPELFQTRTRVSAMAISQNLGTAATAMLPALFAAVAKVPVERLAQLASAPEGPLLEMRCADNPNSYFAGTSALPIPQALVPDF